MDVEHFAGLCQLCCLGFPHDYDLVGDTGDDEGLDVRRVELDFDHGAETHDK